MYDNVLNKQYSTGYILPAHRRHRSGHTHGAIRNGGGCTVTLPGYIQTCSRYTMSFGGGEGARLCTEHGALYGNVCPICEQKDKPSV